MDNNAAFLPMVEVLIFRQRNYAGLARRAFGGCVASNSHLDAPPCFQDRVTNFANGRVAAMAHGGDIGLARDGADSICRCDADASRAWCIQDSSDKGPSFDSRERGSASPI